MLKKLVINSKPPKGEDGYKTFSVRIKNDLVESLDALASSTGRSRNELIGIMIKFALDNCGVEDANSQDEEKEVYYSSS